MRSLVDNEVFKIWIWESGINLSNSETANVDVMHGSEFQSGEVQAYGTGNRQWNNDSETTVNQKLQVIPWFYPKMTVLCLPGGDV